MAGANRVQRLTDAEQLALADANPGAYDAYLVARTVESGLMTPDERSALSHSDRSNRFAEAFAIGLRRKYSDVQRGDSLTRMIEAERQKQMAQRNCQARR